MYWLRGYDRSDLNVGITIFISFSLANKTKEGRNISNYLDNRVTCQQIVNFLHFDAFTVWPEPIWIKVKKSWLLLPQHQSTEYIPKRPRICINWNHPFQTQIHSVKVPLNVNIAKQDLPHKNSFLKILWSEVWCRFWASWVCTLMLW